MVAKIFQALSMLICALVAASANQLWHTGQNPMTRPVMTHQQIGMRPVSDHNARQGRLIYDEESTRIKTVETCDNHGRMTTAQVPEKTGHVFYISPEGTKVKLDYLANENGYRAVSFFSNEDALTNSVTMFKPVSENSAVRFPNSLNAGHDHVFKTPSHSSHGKVWQSGHYNHPTNYRYEPAQRNSYVDKHQHQGYYHVSPVPVKPVYTQFPTMKMMTGLREHW